MTTRKKGRTTRRHRRVFETYEEPDMLTAEGGSTPQVAATPTAPEKVATAHKNSQLSSDVQKILDEFVDSYTSLGVGGLRKQFKEVAAYRPPDYKYKFSAFEAHPMKNRYVDVVCLDDTRVHLTLNVPPSTDYIHANWVKFEGHDKVFIATQAPLDSTVEDFWRMVFQEGCPHVVNLTKCIEDGKAKCIQYWPLVAGQYHTFGKMFVNTKKVESEGRFMIYTVEVLPEGCSNSNIVKVLHMTSWPDRGLPMSGRHVLRVIRQVSGFYDFFLERSLPLLIRPTSISRSHLVLSGSKLDNGPIVMHCSAGIGRTGTVILIDVILRQLFQCKHVNLVDLFKQLRNQRASSIQTEGQYVFIVISVLDYLKIKCPKYKDKVNRYLEDFRNAMMLC